MDFRCIAPRRKVSVTHTCTLHLFTALSLHLTCCILLTIHLSHSRYDGYACSMMLLILVIPRETTRLPLSNRSNRAPSQNGIPSLSTTKVSLRVSETG